MNWLHVAAPRPTILAVRASAPGSVAALGVKESASNAQQRRAHRTTRSAPSVTRRPLLPAHFLKAKNGFKIGFYFLNFACPDFPSVVLIVRVIVAPAGIEFFASPLSEFSP